MTINFRDAIISFKLNIKITKLKTKDEYVLLDADDDDETKFRIVNNRTQVVVKILRFFLLTSSTAVLEANVANNETADC